jgi:hypothetical protein
VIAKNISYLAAYLPPIEAARGTVTQDGALEAANVVFAHLFSTTWVNLRVGRFEPAYVAFSDKRRLAVSPYEIYSFAYSVGPEVAQTQEGIEITGYGPQGINYAAGAVNGSEMNGSSIEMPDLYARLAKVFGSGEGQTAGQRLGISYYYGQMTPPAVFPASFLLNLVEVGPTISGATAASVGINRSFYRFGADASLNYKWVNLSLQYMLHFYEKGLLSTTKNSQVNGGFAELNAAPLTSLVGFARYDLVRLTDMEYMKPDIDRYTLGFRFYPTDQLALHLEYSHRLVKEMGQSGKDLSEDFVTARLDFAF